jgi:hypothetical protein
MFYHPDACGGKGHCLYLANNKREKGTGRRTHHLNIYINKRNLLLIALLIFLSAIFTDTLLQGAGFVFLISLLVLVVSYIRETVANLLLRGAAISVCLLLVIYMLNEMVFDEPEEKVSYTLPLLILAVNGAVAYFSSKEKES